MHDAAPPSPAVVVGIDGSRRAIGAALWAVDEAADRDLPLRLICAMEPRDVPVADEIASATSALRQAAVAVESTGRPVKIETDAVRGDAADVLLAASRAAAMLCIGALGVNHATGRRPGSVASVLLPRATSPVAIVRTDAPRADDDRWIVTEQRETPGGATVLALAIDEARLRDAPLRVIGGTHAERSLARYRLRYPNLDVEALSIRGKAVDHLADLAHDIQLLVVGPDRCHQLTQLSCSVLVAGRHGAL